MGAVSFYERFDVCHVPIPVPLEPIKYAFEDIMFLSAELRSLVKDMQLSENFTLAHHLYHYIFGTIDNRFSDSKNNAAIKNTKPTISGRLKSLWDMAVNNMAFSNEQAFSSPFSPGLAIHPATEEGKNHTKNLTQANVELVQKQNEIYDKKIKALSDLESAAVITDLDAIKDKLLVDKRKRVRDLIHQLQLALVRLVQPDDQEPIVDTVSMLNNEQEIPWTDAIMDWFSGSLENYGNAYNYLSLIANNVNLDASLIDYDIRYPPAQTQYGGTDHR